MSVPDQVFPDYEGANVSKVPAALGSALCGGENPLAEAFAGVDTDVDRVVLLLVDAFGLDRWREYAPRTPFFRRVEAGTEVTPMTNLWASRTRRTPTRRTTGRGPRVPRRVPAGAIRF